MFTLSALPYFGHEAMASMRESPGLSALATATIAAAMVVVGVFAMTLYNLEAVALVWGRAAAVSVYLSDDLDPGQQHTVRDRLASFGGVAEAVLVTPEEALARFAARGDTAAALVEGVSVGILPAAVELTLKPGQDDFDTVATVGKKAEETVGVSWVDYGQDEFKRLTTFIAVLRVAALGLGALLLAVTALIVANTIRLTVYARRDEIGILRLVGATAGFVRTPFLIEGAVWGAVGGVGAAVFMWLCDLMLAPRLSRGAEAWLGGLTLRFTEPNVAGLLVVLGAALGVAGSALAVRRFLGVRAVADAEEA